GVGVPTPATVAGHGPRSPLFAGPGHPTAAANGVAPAMYLDGQDGAWLQGFVTKDAEAARRDIDREAQPPLGLVTVLGPGLETNPSAALNDVGQAHVDGVAIVVTSIVGGEAAADDNEGQGHIETGPERRENQFAPVVGQAEKKAAPAPTQGQNGDQDQHQ